MNLLRLITFRQQAAGFDPDAQAFITAAGITDSTQQSAINTLVLDLKGYGIWTKMKAVYPFVGGTATTHKYNLMDPRDLDAAFRLSFINSWTHDADGAQGNSTNGYADTFLNGSTELSATSTHLSAYSFLDINTNAYDLGNLVTSPAVLGTHLGLGTLAGSSRTLRVRLASGTASNDNVIYNTVGFFVGNREPSSTNIKTYQNGTLRTDYASTSSSHLNETMILGTIRFNGSISTPSNRKYSFVSIGDGLSATEVQNLTTAVNSYQQTLGRFWVPSGLDADAENFIYAASIADSTQQSAVNQLVLDLKSYGLWSKMLAIYPMVGGTANTHKYNLKDPRDLDAAFRLTFSAGWTHSSNGALPNGSSAWAESYLNGSTELSATSTHLSLYSRTNAPLQNRYDMGNIVTSPAVLGTHLGIGWVKSVTNSTFRTRLASETPSDANTVPNTTGFFIGNRAPSSSNITNYRNGSLVESYTSTASSHLNQTIVIGAIRSNNSITQYSNKEFAFMSIGDGLTSTEVSNFYTAVQAFQTTLGRQV